jgi:hypothetical protein
MKVKKTYLIHLLFVCCFFCGLSGLSAQEKNTTADQLASRLNQYTDTIPQTAVYLRTSKGVYESMEDLWFKAYSLDAKDHILSDIDKTLYVRLTKAGTDTVVWKEKYLLRNGVADGHIYLDSILSEGNYLLDAYSAHSFAEKRPFFYASQPVRIIKNILSLGKKDKAITAPPGGKEKIQFNLLPEGGHLIAGTVNNLAFKAVNPKGEPVQVSGTLIRDNKPIQEFKTTHAGMGAFLFKPETGKKYELRLNGVYADTAYPLPEIQNTGINMRLMRNDADSLSFKIAQNNQEKRKIHLRIQVRGVTQLIATALLTDSLEIKLPTKEVTNGIAEVTVFDDNLQALTERLVYIHHEQQLYITTNLSRTTFGKREKVSIKIKTQDQYGKPVPAQLGINIYDRLYEGGENDKDILTHYYLSTQLRGRIYDPSYYFNPEHKDRKAALDLLLLCQGWRSYQWNEENLKSEVSAVPTITDYTKGRLVAVRTKKKAQQQQFIMAFNSEENSSSIIRLDTLGNFILAPEELSKGRRIYLKNFAQQDEEYTIEMEDAFANLQQSGKNRVDGSPVPGLKPTVAEAPAALMTRGGITLNEVKITAKTETVFRDKYLGKLDSAAKLEGNTDFVGHNDKSIRDGWLNCPACSGGPRPIEGAKYTIYIGKNRPTSHPFSFGAGDFDHIIYHYPKFTEEELLKKYKLSKTTGYYPSKEFYNPDYDKEPNSLPDYRNTLLWQPVINTNADGEATVTFFCSDINTGFNGIIEGVSAAGLLGKNEFRFNVR